MITNNSGQEQPFFQSKQDTLTTDRRGFLRMMAVGAAGLTLGVNFSSSAVAGAHKGTINSVGEFEPNAFVRISPDNTVYVMMKHLEMGQGSFTGLATLVAEELDADWSQIVAEGAPAASDGLSVQLKGLAVELARVAGWLIAGALLVGHDLIV